LNKAIVDNKRAASQELAHYRRQKIKKQINHAGSPGPGPPTTLRYVPPFHGLLSDKLRIGPANATPNMQEVVALAEWNENTLCKS